MVAFSHDGHGCKCGHAGLTHGNDVSTSANRVDEQHHVFDVIIERKRAVLQAHIAGIVPVGDVHVVVLQQRARCLAQQRCEVA